MLFEMYLIKLEINDLFGLKSFELNLKFSFRLQLLHFDFKTFSSAILLSLINGNLTSLTLLNEFMIDFLRVLLFSN